MPDDSATGAEGDRSTETVEAPLSLESGSGGVTGAENASELNCFDIVWNVAEVKSRGEQDSG